MGITYPPEMLPSPDPDDEVEIIVVGELEDGTYRLPEGVSLVQFGEGMAKREGWQ